jgi:hypothetical protein
MSSMGRTPVLPLLAALLVCGCSRRMGVTSNGARAASVLFAEFETVFYSKADLVDGSGAYRQLSKQDADTLRVPFADFVGGLDSLRNSAPSDILSNGEAVLVGAKDFRPPAGLGSVQSNFCYVVVLRGQGGPDLHKYFSGSPAGSASGNPIWQWSAPPQEGHPAPYTFYIAQASSSYIIMSNDLRDVQDTASQLISSEKSTPTLAGIRDWVLLRSHNYWGYRHYRHTEDASEAVASGASDVTPSAQDLIFFADPKQRTGTLRLLAADATAAQKLNESMAKARAALPPLKPSGIGAWEAAISFTADQQTTDRMFDVMGLFGFAVYL